MTQPDEATMPDRPEKAHGDALEEVVDDRPDESTAQTEPDQQS